MRVRHPGEGGDPVTELRHPGEGGDPVTELRHPGESRDPGTVLSAWYLVHRQADCRSPRYGLGPNVGRRPLAALRTPHSGREVPRTKYQVLFAIFIFHFSSSISLAQVQQQEIPSPLSARAVSPRFEHLELEDGLSQGSIHDLHQDTHGFLWIATQDGLNRYDGHEIKVYNHEPFDDETLTDGWISDIDEDADGALWLPTLRGGLNRMDPVTEKFTSYRHDPDDSTSVLPGQMNDVLVDSDGRIWVAGGRGLSRMDAERKGIFERFEYDPDDPTSLCHIQAFSVFEDSSGLIWVGTENGLCVTDRRNPGSFERLLQLDRAVRFFFATSEGEVHGMLERLQEPGVLWVGTAAGLVRLEVASRRTELYVPHPDYRGTNDAFNMVIRFAQDPSNPGVLWIPTWGGGLSRFEIRTKQFVTYRADAENPNSLLQDALLITFADRSGVMWVGTNSQGLSRFNPASVSFAHYRHNPGSRTSIPGRLVLGLHQSRDGVVWVGTVDDNGQARLSSLDRENGTARLYANDPSDPTSRDPGWVVAIEEDEQGNVWVNSDRGLDRLDRRTDRFSHYRHDPESPDAPGSVPPFGVQSLFEDRSGKLWVGARGGVAWMGPERDGRFTRIRKDPDDPETLSQGWARQIYEDLAGFVWVATTGGLNRIDPETGKVTRYLNNPEDPTSIAGSPGTVLERRREPGILWVGTSGGGLSRLDTQTGKATHLTVRNGLPNNTVYGILEDNDGRIWISTNHGLSRFDPEAGVFKNFGVEIGLQGLEFNFTSFHRGLHGEMFFGGTNGLNAFFPNELSGNINAPQVELVDFKLFNESVKTTGAIALERSLSETEVLRLDYSQNEISFDFVAFHFADPAGNQYAYKLEGFNDDWVHVGQHRSASFTNLAPGEYTFRVKAANSDGIWNEEGASIRLIVEPPFWATWWFRIFAVAAVGSILFGGFKLRVKQIADRNRLLEGEVAKRTGELRETNDRLALTNDQLEQSHTIVEAINQETSFRRLLTKILEEARVIPGVEKATAIVRMPDDLFHVRASSGWDVEGMEHIRLTPKQAHDRYVAQAEELARDIFVSKDVAGRAGTEEMAEFGRVASFLVLRVHVENQVSGYLVFDNLTDANAFDRRDGALLERLREHIQSAFIKTRILEDLQHTLTDLRQTQDRLVQSEKMASLGQLTAGIAHEIKNPLNFVNNFSEVSAEIANDIADEIAKSRDELPAHFVEELDALLENLRLNTQKVAEHGKRADGIVQNMLEHSKVGEGQRAPTDLNDLLDEYVTLAHHGLKSRGGDFDVKLERHFDESVGKVEVVPQDLGRVLMNLFGNAFDALRVHGASHGDPTVTVSTARSGRHVEIRVGDNGPGIPEKIRSKIFEPFFTTKPTGSGTGLGLSMSYDIVTKGHGGTLDVVSEEGQGSTFIVRLPV